MFRSGVEAVQIDVFVTDEHDRPVSGLTADDFQVYENGQRQVITTFASVSRPLDLAASLPNGAESDVQSNSREHRHVYLILLAVNSANTALRTRYVVRKFLTEYFGDDDAGAVVALGASRTQDTQDFTSNRRLLLAALDKYSGGDQIVATSRNMARDFWEAMEVLARIPGGRKSVLLFGGVPALDAYAIMDYKGFVLRLDAEYAHAGVAAATQANIRIYPIDPSGVVAGGPGGLGGDGLPFPGNAGQREADALASLTGGFAHRSGNDYDAVFERLVRETTTFYVLGFNSTIKRREGRYISLEVKPGRPGLRVRARSGYVEQLEYIRARTPAEPIRTPVENALANPLATTGLPMRVVAAPYRKSGREATVVLAVQIDASGLLVDERNGRYSLPLELRHLATDVTAKIHSEFRHRTVLGLSESGYRNATSAGVRFVSQFDLPAGRYQLRVASASGARAGSVVYDLDVPDFGDGPLTLSGVSVATLGAVDMLTVRPDRNRRTVELPKGCRARECQASVVFNGTLVPWRATVKDGDDAQMLRDVLPAPPTTARNFMPDETLVLFAEVYDNSRARRDPPYSIDVAAKLVSTTGDTIRVVTDQRQSRAARRASGGHPFTLRLPLDDVPAGAYVLELEARTGGDAGHRAVRAIPVRVSASGRVPFAVGE